MSAIIPSLCSVSTKRGSEFKFRPHAGVKGAAGSGGWRVSGCPPQHQPSSFFFFFFFLLISSLLPWFSSTLLPPPSVSPFHFPVLVMSPAASDVKVSQAEGTMGAGRKCQPPVHACSCMCSARVFPCADVTLLTGY